MLFINNLIKIRSQHLLPIFYQLFTSRSVEDLKSFFRGHVRGQHEYIRCLSSAFQNAYARLVCWIL